MAFDRPGAGIADRRPQGPLRPPSRSAAGVLLCATLLAGCNEPEAGAGPRGNPVVWVVDAMQQVAPDAAAGDERSIELFAARGEYEPFQVVVQAPAGGLEDITVVATDLRSPDGGRIPAANLTLYREHYITLASGSADWRRDEPLPAGATAPNAPLGPGVYAEPLIPFVDPETGAALEGAPLQAVPFSLEEGRNQPIWIDIHVPRDTRPGSYEGEVTVASPNGASSASVVLHVWNFELPLRPSLRSDFGFWNASDHGSALELVKHKLMPRSFDPSSLEALLDAGLNGVGLDFWSRLDAAECERAAPDLRPPPTLAEVREAAGAFDGLFRYAYFADEIDDCRTDPGLAQAVRSYARVLQEGGVTPLLTTYPFDAFWVPGPYVWAIMPVGFEDRRGIERAVSAGQSIWSYNAVYLDAYSPKWLLDYAPLNFRLQPGFISQSLDLSGLLYWAVDYWVPGEEWDRVTAFGESYPGEGVLTYPGADVGIDRVAPGMRLKWIREGVEDFEYVELLKRQGEGSFALEVARSVGRSFKDWSRSSAEVHAARKRLGDRLHALAAD